MILWGYNVDVIARLTRDLYTFRQAIRRFSDVKLARRVWAARMRLAYHDRGEAEFRDARGWARERRQVERERMHNPAQNDQPIPLNVTG